MQHCPREVARRGRPHAQLQGQKHNSQALLQHARGGQPCCCWISCCPKDRVRVGLAGAHICAISGTRGSSGLGSVSSEQIDSST